MSAEAKRPLIIVAGSEDHTPLAQAYYQLVEVVFANDFYPKSFRPLWKDRSDSEEAAEQLIAEIDEEADKIVAEQQAAGGVLLDNRPALLGVSVGGSTALNLLLAHPDKYSAVYTVSSRNNLEGIDGLEAFNPAGATMVRIFDRSIHKLDTSRVRTGSPAGGDDRVTLIATLIPGVKHDEFPVSGSHVKGVSQITTQQPHVQVITRFLKGKG